MELKISIKNIKNISQCELSLPIESGIFCIAGTNGCGKSTFLTCLAKSVFLSSLKFLKEHDYNKESRIEFVYGDINEIWRNDGKGWKSNVPGEQKIKFNGLYEGSLFYGTRFADSVAVDGLVDNKTIKDNEIVCADDYIKENLSYILHGDKTHYGNLMKIKNRAIAKRFGLGNVPYFNKIHKSFISQYRMSSGECLLVSLLHFIYNSIIRRSLPADEPVLMLIDEIELALHPIAVSRFIDLLNEIIKQHDNVTVVLTSHSPEVIRKMSPNNIIMMEECNNTIEFYTPCYPSYAIRDVYIHDGYDFVILVEDVLSKYIVEKVLDEMDLKTGKLINVLPVGGWENVLKLQESIYSSNLFSLGTTVFSILDGDIKNDVCSKYKKLQKMFLPISSLEKYIYKVCTDPSQKSIKREINDKIFLVESISSILAEYNKNGDSNGKALYRRFLKNVEERGISESEFVKAICDIVLKYEDIKSFKDELKSRILRDGHKI